VNDRQVCGSWHERPPATPVPEGGPGTELKRVLAWFRFDAVDGCECNATAAQMNAWGPDGCEEPERLAWILGRLRDEAGRRGVPFLEPVARGTIRLAIAAARRRAGP